MRSGGEQLVCLFKMQNSLFYIYTATLATTMLMLVSLVAGLDLDDDTACERLNYVDSQLRMINPETRGSSEAILDMLAEVGTNSCPAEKRPSNDALYEQLYHARVGASPRCEPQEFTQLSTLKEKTKSRVPELELYVDNELGKLFKLCKDQINLNVDQEQARWNETYPVDSILLDQLTDSIYAMAPFDTSYGRISSSDVKNGFLQSFIVSTGLAEPDRESELERIQSICRAYESVMAKSYSPLAQFCGNQSEFDQFTTVTGNAVKKVKVCEQAKTLTSLSV